MVFKSVLMENKIGKHTIQLYSEIEETPIDRYSKFNKYMILNDKIGSNFTDIDKHFTKLYALINEPEKLKNQLTVFRQLVFSLESEQSFESLAYACLVKKIDGEPRDDLTVQGLNETLSKIQWLQAKELKKKSIRFQKLRERTLQMLTRTFSINRD